MATRYSLRTLLLGMTVVCVVVGFPAAIYWRWRLDEAVRIRQWRRVSGLIGVSNALGRDGCKIDVPMFFADGRVELTVSAGTLSASSAEALRDSSATELFFFGTTIEPDVDAQLRRTFHPEEEGRYCFDIDAERPIHVYNRPSPLPP